jgi:hemolysin III
MSLVDLLQPDERELAEHYPNRAERVADLAVHVVGMVAGAVAAGVLFSLALMRGGVPLVTAVAIYAACLMAMLACSAIYNLTRPSPARRLLRRLDEAAIFLMIAGSYTPFAIRLLPADLAVAVTTTVWLAAFAGAAGKVLWPRIADATWCVIYVGFAWAGVAFLIPALHGLTLLTGALLAIGGLTYSAGVLIYLNQKIPYRRAIWHGVVVLAAGLHYAAILTGIVLMPGA